MTTTLTDVELARPGDWPLATGKTRFTEQMLADAAAFYRASGEQRIPISLGHRDDRFTGEPTFGSVTNVRLATDDKGPVLLGDIQDMPQWLAAAAPKRWPNRSVEGWQNFPYDGREYSLVLTGVALLGVAPPAVRNIRSLRDLKVALAASAATRIIAAAPGADEPTEGADMDPEETPQAPEAEPEQPSSVTLDAATYAEQQERMAYLEAQAAAQATSERDAFIGQAVREGRLFPAQRAHFAQLWDLDPAGTRAAILGLPANTLPVAATGYDAGGDARIPDEDAGIPAEFAHLFPPAYDRRH